MWNLRSRFLHSLVFIRDDGSPILNLRMNRVSGIPGRGRTESTEWRSVWESVGEEGGHLFVV